MLGPTKKGIAGLEDVGVICPLERLFPVNRLRTPFFFEGLDSTGSAFAGGANHNGAFATHIMIFCCFNLVRLWLIAAIFTVWSVDVPETLPAGAILMLSKCHRQLSEQRVHGQ